MVSLVPKLDGMGNDTFRCPQCLRVLSLADDTYNPETQTCRACGRGETPPVPETRIDSQKAPDVARWTEPTEEEVPPPKVS
jgi:hypothetical protein